MTPTQSFPLEVLKYVPDAAFIDSYLYFQPVRHVLAGFCAETTPHGIYIARYMYPLFDRSKRLNLNFSDRLPNPRGYIDFSEIDKENAAGEFVRRISPMIEQVRAHRELDDLCMYIESNETILRNEWVMKNYALLLVRLGRYDEAIERIDAILDQEWTGTRQRIADECTTVRNKLISNPDSAQKLVADWEDETRLNFSLPID